MTTCCHSHCPEPTVTTLGRQAYCYDHFQQDVWPTYRKVAAEGGVNPLTGDRLYPALPAGTLVGMGVYDGPTRDERRSHLVCDVCGHRFVGRTTGEPCPRCVWQGLRNLAVTA